jgi:hypothetical protein
MIAEMKCGCAFWEKRFVLDGAAPIARGGMLLESVAERVLGQWQDFGLEARRPELDGTADQITNDKEKFAELRRTLAQVIARADPLYVRGVLISFATGHEGVQAGGATERGPAV